MKKHTLFFIVLLVACMVLLASCTFFEGSDDSDKKDNTRTETQTNTSTNGETAEHEHTYSTMWSSDISGHWRDAICCHTEDRIDFGEHVDSDNDAKCDICSFCNHNLGQEWTYDNTFHWKSSNCQDHPGYKGDLASHDDGNGDAKCDICGYCRHMYSYEWSASETHHWHAPRCSCDLPPKDVGEHIDDDKNGICDICESVICEHIFSVDWSYDDVYHWNDAICGCNITKNLELHVDDDSNGCCDTCAYVIGTVSDVIASINNEAYYMISSAFVDYYKKTVNDYGSFETDVIAGVEYYDNYAVYKTIDGDTFYCSYYGEDEALLIIRVDAEGNVSREGNVTEYPTGTQVAFHELNFSVNATNYEELVIKLYNLEGKVGLAEGVNAEAGRAHFSYAYTDENAYVVYVEFELDKETNGIKSAKVTIDGYAMSDVTIDTENNTYVVADGASKVKESVYAITQTFGEAMDSTENPNPYSGDNSLVTEDFTVVTKDEDGNVTGTYGEEDTIKIVVGDTITLYFDVKTAELAKLSNVEISNDAYDKELYCYVPFGTKDFKIKANKAGTYTVTITAEDVELNLNIEAEYKPITSFETGVADEWGDVVGADSTNVYVGNEVVVSAIVGNNENPYAICEVIEGDADYIVISQDDKAWEITAYIPGTYVIKLTSADNENFSDTITIVAEEAPSVADFLNGTFTGTTMANRIDITAVFTSIDEITGTVVVTLKGAYIVNVDGEYQTVSANGTATYSYVYNEQTGMLVLTKDEGDDIFLEYIMVDNYEVVAGVKNDMACTLEKQETVGGGEELNATTSPFEITITDTYIWIDEFTFVAGEAGTYTFIVPTGVGFYSKERYDNWDSPEFDFQMNSATSFSMSLEAGEVVDFYVGAISKGTYEIEFTYEKQAGGDDPVVPSTELVEGENTVVIGEDQVENGVDYTYTAPVDGTYSITSNDLMAIFFDSIGMQIGRGQVSLTAGQEVTIKLVSISGAGTYVATLTIEETSDEPQSNTLVEGENTVVIGEDQVESGVDYTYTAPVTGTYTVYSNYILAIFFDANGFQLGRGQVSLEAGQVVTVKLVSFSGTGTYTATLAIEAAAGGDEGEETTGTEENPTVLDTLPESITINSDTFNKVYYIFTATESGTLTFTWPTADSWVDIFEMDGTDTTSNNDGVYLTETFSFEIEAGKTYRFSLGTWYVAGEVTVTISVKDSIALDGATISGNISAID